MMRSLSISAFGHPSDTKLTFFEGAACSDELTFRLVMTSRGASAEAAPAQVAVRNERNERNINEQKDGPQT